MKEVWKELFREMFPPGTWLVVGFCMLLLLLIFAAISAVAFFFI